MCSVRLLAAYSQPEYDGCISVSASLEGSGKGDKFAQNRVMLRMPQTTHARTEIRGHEAAYDAIYPLNKSGIKTMEKEVAGAVAAVASGLQDRATLLLFGSARSGKTRWLLGAGRQSSNSTLLFACIRSLLDQFGEVSVRAAGLVGRQVVDLALDQDAVQVKIRADSARDRLSRDGKVDMRGAVRIVDLPAAATQYELDAARSKRITSIPTGSGSNHTASGGVRTIITGLQRVTVSSLEQIGLLVSFLRQNLRSLRLNSRQVGPLGECGTANGISLSISIDLPNGGRVSMLKISGALQLQEHDNRAGFSEAATRASAVARRARAGAANQANLAVSNVLGWLALDSLNALASPQRSIHTASGRSSGTAAEGGGQEKGSRETASPGGYPLTASAVRRRMVSMKKVSAGGGGRRSEVTAARKLRVGVPEATASEGTWRARPERRGTLTSPRDLSPRRSGGLPLVPFRDHPVTRLMRQALLEEGQTLVVTFLRGDVEYMEDAAVHIANSRKLRVVQRSRPPYETAAPETVAAVLAGMRGNGGARATGRALPSEEEKASAGLVVTVISNGPGFDRGRAGSGSSRSRGLPADGQARVIDRRYESQQGGAAARAALGNSGEKEANEEVSASADPFRIVAGSMAAAAAGVQRIGRSMQDSAAIVQELDSKATQLIRKLGTVAEHVARQGSDRLSAEGGPGAQTEDGNQPSSGRVGLSEVPKLIADALRLASRIKQGTSTASKRVFAAADAVERTSRDMRELGSSLLDAPTPGTSQEHQLSPRRPEIMAAPDQSSSRESKAGQVTGGGQLGPCPEPLASTEPPPPPTSIPPQFAGSPVPNVEDKGQTGITGSLKPLPVVQIHQPAAAASKPRTPAPRTSSASSEIDAGLVYPRSTEVSAQHQPAATSSTPGVRKKGNHRAVRQRLRQSAGAALDSVRQGGTGAAFDLDQTMHSVVHMQQPHEQLVDGEGPSSGQASKKEARPAARSAEEARPATRSAEASSAVPRPVDRPTDSEAGHSAPMKHFQGNGRAAHGASAPRGESGGLEKGESLERLDLGEIVERESDDASQGSNELTKGYSSKDNLNPVADETAATAAARPAVAVAAPEGPADSAIGLVDRSSATTRGTAESTTSDDLLGSLASGRVGGRTAGRRTMAELFEFA